MPNSDFVKGACRRCGGHIEFPAEGIGRSIPCPHCGQITELTAGIAKEGAPQVVPRPESKTSNTLAIATVVFLALLAVGLTCALVWKQSQRHNHISSVTTHPTPSPAQSQPAPAQSPETNTPTVTTATPVASQVQPGEETNDFAILPYKLEQAPGSSLVFVTGTVSNLSDSQRFGVRLQFSLLDADSNSVGKATDYQGLMEPHSDWHFKALVMASKTASAQFNSIEEMK